MDHGGHKAAGLVGSHVGVGDQDDGIAHVHQVGGGTVDAQHAGAALARDGVGLQPGAVGDVNDGNQFTGEDIGGFKEIEVYRHRTYVMQVGMGHRSAVNLGLKHFPVHRG